MAVNLVSPFFKFHFSFFVHILCIHPYAKYQIQYAANLHFRHIALPF